MEFTNKKVLVTGGASGIGLALAERFLSLGSTVIICGRRQDALNEARTKNPSLITKTCDLSVEKERVSLYTWISENHPDLNVLVNNAGIQNWMQIGDADFYERAKKEIETNINAPIHLMALFSQLKSLDAFMNVSSGLAYVPFTKVPVYSATKSFLHSFTLSSRYQLRGKNIQVIELIPPVLNTDLGGKGLHDHAPPVSGFADAVFQQLAEDKSEITFGFSEAMAKAGPPEVLEAFNRLNPLPV